MTTTNIFYKNKQVHTVKTGQQQNSVFRGIQLPLAQNHLGNGTYHKLLATDTKASVFNTSDATSRETHCYSAYGSSTTIPSSQSILGYNGEVPTLGNSYILGNGHRLFSTLLMRFLSPDSISPFGEGGINCYAYCSNDPINYTDPSGHMRKVQNSGPTLQQRLTKILSRRKKLESEESTLKSKIAQKTAETEQISEKLANIEETYGLYRKINGVKVRAPDRRFAEAKNKRTESRNQGTLAIEENNALKKQLKSVALEYNRLSDEIENLEKEVGTATFDKAYKAAEETSRVRS
ncbi:RHS repeat-associated core domain-containing protein [Pseudomonas sp.]|uniref:RHS repeat-associated core domain-containing protein n=1 Tax=Pseudomonas sp. TaxID=306 RepID=UPI0025D16515|nr:RHS repeat-associated core domain-containing protein [Pseudomonas sp.]